MSTAIAEGCSAGISCWQPFSSGRSGITAGPLRDSDLEPFWSGGELQIALRDRGAVRFRIGNTARWSAGDLVRVFDSCALGRLRFGHVNGRPIGHLSHEVESHPSADTHG